MFNLGEFGATVVLDTTDFDNKMKDIDNKTKKSSKGLGGFAKSVAKIASGIGVFTLVSKGIDMIRSSTDRAISRVDTLNQFPAVLQRMGFSADDAQKSTKRLIDGIDGLPTTLDGITTNVQRMINVFQDTDLATESALALNNAFLASGASTADAERGIDQYIKMLSTGKVEMDNWTTLQETMPYALQKTAEAFGFAGRSAQRDLYDSLKSGKITIDDFNAKMIELSEETGGFAEIAKTATKGIRTSWTNVQTAVVNGVATTIQAFDDWFESKGLGGVSGLLDKVKDSIKLAFGTVNNTIPVVLDWFDKLYKKVEQSTAFTTLKNVVSDATQAVKDLWERFMQSDVLDNAGGLLERIADILLSIDFERIAQGITEFLDRWTPVIAGVVAGIAVFQLITSAITLWTTVTTLATGVGTAFGAVLAFITSPIGLVVIAIGLLVTAGVLLYKNWETIKEKAIGIWTAVTDFFIEFKDLTIKAFSGLYDWLNNKTNGTFGQYVQIIKSYLKMTSDNIKAVWEFIKNTFQNVLNIIKGLVTGDFSLVRQAIQNQMQNSRNLLSNILNNIKTFFSNILGNIVSTVRNRFNTIRDNMMRPIEQARDKIKSIVNRIKGFFSNMNLKIPSIKLPKLPKFTISGNFSLNPPRVPKLSVNWNAAGGIFTKPTIFNTTTAGLQGVGEAGAEAILPLTTNVLSDIGKGISSTMKHNNHEEVSLLKEQNQLLRQLVNKDTHTYLDGKIITKSVSNRQADDYNIYNYVKGNR